MKKKIVGIFVSLMFIISFLIGMVGFVTSDDLQLEEKIDQSQELCYECELFENYAWQEFVPTITDLIRVDVCVAQFGGSTDLTLSIEKPLGFSLTSKILPVSAIPSNECNWISFDFPDITVTPDDNYYIVLSYPLGGEYGWCNAWNESYPQGDSDVDYYDYCFRTVGYEVLSPPDLIVNNVWIENGSIGYQIRNIGNGAAPEGHYTALYVNDVFVMADYVITDLIPGENYTGFFNYTWICTPPSDSIKVHVDYTSNVLEFDDDNNQWLEQWYCEEESNETGQNETDEKKEDDSDIFTIKPNDFKTINIPSTHNTLNITITFVTKGLLNLYVIENDNINSTNPLNYTSAMFECSTI